METGRLAIGGRGRLVAAPYRLRAPERNRYAELKGVVDGDRLVAIELGKYVWASGGRGDSWHQVAELEMEGVCLPASTGLAWALVFDGAPFVVAGTDVDSAAS